MSVFDGLVFCISGRLRDHTRRAFQEILEDNGGEVKSSVTKAVTHLITTEDDVENETSKVSKAKANGIFLVNEDFIHDSVDEGQLKPETDYLLCDSEKKSPKKKKRTTGRKRKRKEVDDDDDDDSQLPTKKGGKDTDSDDYEPPKKKRKVAKKVVKRQKKGNKMIPLPDPASGHESDGEIYCEGEDVYNVVLNQTNVSRNNNKFYKIQLIQTTGGEYFLFTQWGRVGFTGQKSVKGHSSLERAKKDFCSKFKSKTGNNWEDRENFVEKSKKYTMIDISYDDDDDNDDDGEEKLKKQAGGDGGNDNEDMENEVPECTLDPRVQEFIQMIGNKKEFQRVMAAFDIDVNKMPLGKLSKNQIEKGFEILKDLQDVIEKSGNEDDIEELTNEFYTKIPRYWGMKRPPLVDSLIKVKKNREMLENLRDMEIAGRIINDKKKQNTVDPTTYIYNELHCDLVPVELDSEVGKRIIDYVEKTHGPTHSDYSLTVKGIFTVKREGEADKFKKDIGNRMMLWHGSRITNFMGILSEGLRIAPPSAPATGYMFGKGVYFADMVSKSANYCRTNHKNHIGAALLADVALGEQLKRKNADYLSKEDLENEGKDSTWGMGGAHVPDSSTHFAEDECVWPIGKSVKPSSKNSSLLYNEFIVYDVHQINLKYLVLLDFDFL